MNRRIIKQFSSQIGKELRCFPATKRTLLQGLEAELNELPDEATASMEALQNRIGDTSLIVKELQSSVSPEEEQSAIKRRRKKTRLVMGGNYHNFTDCISDRSLLVL